MQPKKFWQHYSGYIVLVLSLVVIFLLGLLLVEIPFGEGLRYFGRMQDEATAMRMMKKQYAVQVQKAALVRVAGFETDVAEAACEVEYQTCTAALDYVLDAGFMTEQAWSTNTVVCNARKGMCLANVTQ